MNNIDKMNEMKALVEQLNMASIAYYNTSHPIMSDTEFDKGIMRLKQLEEETNTILSNSPVHNVGSMIVSELPKIKHSHLMLSLDKCHTIDEVIKFANNKNVVAMFKMDGLTCSATYEDGTLVRLETRGDGAEGTDVMIHASSFINLPLTINKKGTYIIDGETIISYDDFEKINATIKDEEDKYANPRNLASGTLNLLDTNISKQRHLKFVAWDVIEGSDSNSLYEKLESVKDYGFTAVPHCLVPYKALLNKDKTMDNFNSFRERAKELNMPIDGVVIKYDDVKYGASLGNTSHHFRCGIAYKFEDDKFPTKLLDVEWTMGKTGILTPTIVTEPVEIDGTIVERASVHNVSIFNQLHFTKGCTCYLYKANQIIPQCDMTENDGDGLVKIPTECPICHQPTKIVKENDTEVLVCTNDACEGKLLGKLSHFVSKNAMNIDGLSSATLKRLIDLGWLTCFEDIFMLSEHEKVMGTLSGFGKKSVTKLLDNIDKASVTTLDRFLNAIGIYGIGKSTSKDIAKFCQNDISEFYGLMVNKGAESFMVIDGFGQKMADDMNQWWNDVDGECFLDSMMHYITFKDENEEVVTTGMDLSGQTFVITGSLTHYSNRDELVSVIESLGGKASGSVSAKTTALICNDKESNTGKSKKAKDIGVPILSEEDFLKMIGE